MTNSKRITARPIRDLSFETEDVCCSAASLEEGSSGMALAFADIVRAKSSKVGSKNR